MAGLYAAGAVTAGLHGANGLGGNSLAETVGFGRRAGQASADDEPSSSMRSAQVWVLRPTAGTMIRLGGDTCSCVSAHDSRNGWTFLALAAQDAVVGSSATEAAVQPETKYAQLGGDRIAYQVVGQGPPDLVMTTASFGDIDVAWEDPGLALFYRTLASFSRLILLNRRGTGASDPLPPDPLPPWESYAEELAVILDEVGSQRAALLATLDAGPTALFFAATRPARTSALILAHTTAK